jgi:serine/threonine-protein kinase
MGFGQAVATRDGHWLLLRRVVSEEGNGDIYALREGDSTLTPLLTTPARESSPALSPDGKWLAYVSNESGKPEVYVRPFPDVGSAKWQVSLSGGFTPMWAHNGKELFYLDDARALIAVTIQPGPTFTFGGQKVLFSASSYSFAGGYPTFDVAPDDSRFVMIRSVAPSAETELVLIQNWAEELKARAQ